MLTQLDNLITGRKRNYKSHKKIILFLEVFASGSWVENGDKRRSVTRLIKKSYSLALNILSYLQLILPRH